MLVTCPEMFVNNIWTGRTCKTTAIGDAVRPLPKKYRVLPEKYSEMKVGEQFQHDCG